MESGIKKFKIKKICVVSGTRAEYGLLKSVMKAILKRRELKLIFVVTGMHLSKEFGATAALIRKDGFRIDHSVEMDPVDDGRDAMAVAVGKGILGLSGVFKKSEPDVVLVLGDRTEALAAAIAATYQNIVLAHIHGGDATNAGFDESARHAITKLAHIHFAASKKSMKRIIKMGEEPSRVFLTGAPGLDSILRDKLPARETVMGKFHLEPDKPFLILIQHPVTTESGDSRWQMKETLAAIKKLRINTVIIYPNSDTGGRAIIEEIESVRDLPFVRVAKNVPRDGYLALMKYASAMVGNSSGGIIESAMFKIPVVNIGTRQAGRERGANVTDVRHDRREIARAIKAAISDKKMRRRIRRCKNPYGDGRAGERIAKILSSITPDHKLLQKRLNYR